MVKDFPKIESPLERDYNEAGNYVCQTKVKKGYEWVFKDSVAVDKLHGTNVSITKLKSGIEVYNRQNKKDWYTKGDFYFFEGIVEAQRRGYIDLKGLKENQQVFGELIGPKLHGNPYQLDKHLWIPFSKLKEKYSLKFWGDILKTLRERRDHIIYMRMSELFKKLWSPYKRNIGVGGSPEDVTVDSKFEDGLTAEGIVFYSPDGKMAKLRRDMFDWYSGERHER